MHIAFVLPSLSAARYADAPPIRAPALAQLLAMAGPPARNADGIGAAMASLYGVERQTDWPLAALRVASLGIDPADAYWLAADPVTINVGRDDAAFAGVVDDLARGDADALVASLNAHFAGDGLAFIAPRPDAIFARLAVAPRLRTHPPVATRDQPLRTRLPEGPDAKAWRRWQSEIQMLLHEHPVNVLRERTGRPPANSVWFSGGGTLPPRDASGPSIATFADAGLAVALAVHAGSPALALPANLADALERTAEVGVVVVALAPGLRLADAERPWIVPARDALGAGRLQSVTLLADDTGDAVTWRANRPRLWQRLAGRVKRHDLAALLDAARRRE